MRYVSLFSGIEAASVAWEPLGWEPMAFSEIDRFPCRLLAERYPSVPNLGNICDIDWEEFVNDHGRPDVVVGGSPCQSFSVAGGRESLSGESRLCSEYVRAIREIRPSWLVWENVPGVLNTRDNAFGQFLCALWDCGYHDLGWRVLDAQFFGVAQRRRRVFVVGHLGDGMRSSAVLFERESVRGDHPTSREKRKELADRSGRSVEERCVCYDTTQVTSKTNRSNPLPGDPSFTLSASGGAPLLCGCAGFSYKSSAGAGSIGYGEEIAPSLLAGRNDAACCFAIAGNIIGREPENGGHQLGIESDGAMFTLTTADRHGIICMADDTANAAIDQDVAGTLKCGGAVPMVASRYVVRRLTPLECERLQGFPDGYTDLGDTPDAPRYKALGNSMAVPVMRWIGNRIKAVDDLKSELRRR